MKRISIFAVLAVMAMASVGALAANYYWNAASGNWSLGSNWDPAGPPASNAWAIIDNGGTVTIDMDFLRSDAQQVRVYDGAVNQSTNDIQTQYLMLGSDGADGIYNLSGGSLDIALGDAHVGMKADAEATGGNGYFNMSGGTFDVKNLKVGYAVGAYGEFNISDGELNVLKSLIVGNNVAMGNGIFKQTGGDVNITGNLFISQYDSNPFGPLDGYGIYNMEGGVLQMDGSEGGDDTPEGDIYVGSEDGTNAGVMNLKGGEIYTNNFYVIGEDSLLNDDAATPCTGTKLHVFGDFINGSTDNVNFDMARTTLIMAEGGTGWVPDVLPSEEDPFGVAGYFDWNVLNMGNVVDMGAVNEGVIENFAIGNLIFRGTDTGSLWYMLESDIYCYGLVIEEGAFIFLNGYNIYYMPETSGSYYGSKPCTHLIAGVTAYGELLAMPGVDGVVPEPGTIVLIGTGVLGLAAVLRRKYC